MSDEQEHVETPEPADPPAREWTDEDAAKARLFDWKPAEEWEGPIPPGFIEDPRRYMERAENFGPFRALKEQSERKARELEERISRQERMTERALERQRQNYEAQINGLQQQKLAAVENGDVEAYKRLDGQERAIQERIAPPQQQDDMAPHKAALERWAVGNHWFKSDRVMTSAAVALYGEAMDKGIDDPQARLDYVDVAIRREFPHKFEAPEPKRRTSASVDTGLTIGGGKKEGFDSLPKDARDAFATFWKQGVYGKMSEADARKDYLREYNA